LPPGLYWEDDRGFFLRRHGRREALGRIDREAAIKAWVKFNDVPDSNTTPGTFSELIDTFIREELPLVKAAKTRDEYERQCKKLRERWGAESYGVSDADAVQRRCLRVATFNRYLREAERSGKKMVQANHDVKLAHRIFVVARQQGLTEYNPCAGVRYIEEGPRQRAVTQADRDAVAAVAAPAFRLMLRLCEATGMRLTDVRNLRLQQIHDGVVDLRQSKTRATNRPQHWEITPAVQAIFDEAATLPGRTVSMYVFPTRKGTPYSEQGVHHMRREALRKSGLEDLQFRDIRKEAINEHKRLGGNAQEFAGHADPRTTARHYLSDPIKIKPNR
jgi:integrase